MVTFITPKKKAPVSQFRSPLLEIANLFNNAVISKVKRESVDKDAPVSLKEQRVEVTRNSMAYTQKMVLAGIARTAAYQIGLTKDKLDQAINELGRRQREHRGDEISEVSLNRACDWVEQLELQEATLTDLYKETKAIYEMLTGETFKDPEFKPVFPKKITTSSAMERASRYTKQTHALPNSDGVETEE